MNSVATTAPTPFDRPPLERLIDNLLPAAASGDLTRSVSW